MNVEYICSNNIPNYNLVQTFGLVDVVEFSFHVGPFSNYHDHTEVSLDHGRWDFYILDMLDELVSFRTIDVNKANYKLEMNLQLK